MFRLIRVSKSFRSSRGELTNVFHDVSVSVSKGEIFGIIGPSGAGKSTLLRLFNLLERPDSGAIEFQERDISKISNRELKSVRKKIGMIFQDFNLLSNKTVSENVALPLQISNWESRSIEPRVQDCLALVGLEEKLNSYPNELSGGQRQRVAIARAIANHPDLILADEPTSALDPLTKQDILSCLQDINHKLGITIVLSTHEMSIVRKICHRVAILGEGKLQELIPIENGTAQPQSDLGKKLLELT